MDEVMKEYKTCPECNHPWVPHHFQDGKASLCKECGCHWAIIIRDLHRLADDMVDREGKLPEVVGSPAVERARIGEEPRKPFNAERFWTWLIVGILILFVWIKLTKDEERLPAQQTIEERETMELIGEVIRLVEEGKYDEISIHNPGYPFGLAVQLLANHPTGGRQGNLSDP